MKAYETAATFTLQTVVPARWNCAPGLALWAALLIAQSSFGYDQATIGTYSSTTIEKSATAAPNDLASFSSAITPAFSANFGGVFNLPTAVAANSTLFRGTYGTNLAKRLQVTSSNPMQNVTSTGTVVPVSSPNGTTTTADVSGYNFAIGPVSDTNASPVVLPEAVMRVGFTVLSRTHATYPVDVAATVTFSDGTSESATSLIGNVKGTDDTFYGFTAPSGLTITNLALASFSPGTATPVNTRISIDDFAFVTVWTIPPPQVLNVSPFNYAIAKAADGIQFDALSYVVPIDPTGIKLVLNSNDVSTQLAISGNSTNWHAAFSGLIPNQSYEMQITISNEVGVAANTYRFYTMESPFVVFDSGGFSDGALYPTGPLQAVANNGWAWLPPADAAEIIDTGEPAYGPALREMQMGNNQSTYLEFPAAANGFIRFSFDARVSNPFVRTLDLGLNVAGSGAQGSFVAWGVVTNQFGTNSGEFSYFDGSAWLPLRSMDSEWHHYDMTNYLSGPCAGSFEMAVDGAVVGHLLPFRNALALRTAMGRLRLATMSGGVTEFGVVDNLVVEAGPEITGVAPRPQILNVSPAGYTVIKAPASLQFDAFSFLPIEQAGISVVLNSNNVSSQLTLSGNSTNRHVTFTGLVANQVYDLQITVSNQAGTATASSQFYSADLAITFFDSGGFSDPSLYPIGPLPAFGTNGWSWFPPIDAAQIVDSGVPEHGPVLRQTQMGGADQYTVLTFPPVVASVLRITFDARVSNPFVRTLDISVDTASGSQQGSFLAWGVVTNQFGTNSGQLACWDAGTTWAPLLNIDSAWHQYEIVNYCAGPRFAKYDIAVDGIVVGRSLPWRHAISTQTGLGRLRIAAIRGGVGEYAEVDNILVAAGPAVALSQAVMITNPTASAGVFTLSFQSQFGVLYTLQSRAAVSAGSWTDLVSVLGDGTLKTITDTNLASTRFYQVRGQ